MSTKTPYEVYFKTFLGGWSFANGDRTLTIKGIDKKEMYDMETGGTKTGITLLFEEEELPMVMNITNASTIAEVLGTNITEDWIGRKIIVGTSKIKAFGKMHDAIRVRNTKPDETVYTCEDCGSVIKAAAGKQPSELVEIAKRNTGRALCLDCMKKAKEAEGNAE